MTAPRHPERGLRRSSGVLPLVLANVFLALAFTGTWTCYYLDYSDEAPADAWLQWWIFVPAVGIPGAINLEAYQVIRVWVFAPILVDVLVGIAVWRRSGLRAGCSAVLLGG